MIENALEGFSNDIFTYITGETKNSRSMLVKKHSENLQTHGDFSFPNTIKSWHGLLRSDKINTDESLLCNIGKSTTDLIHESNNWKLRINDVMEVKDRVYMFLDRPKAIDVGLSEALRNNQYISQKLLDQSLKFRVNIVDEETNCLTYLRVKYFCNSIKNLCALCPQNDDTAAITVSSKPSVKTIDEIRVLCGAVLNAKTGVKETVISADEFIRLRQNEMTLIAQHKYGVRVTTDSKWKEFIAHLGESAVAFELLQAKPSSAVKINFECSSAGSSKGASFILYNCARLETIIKTYSEKVEEGTYPPLPELNECDLTLLTQEDEWNLIFNYILGLPSLLSSCVDIKGQNSEFRPHQICGFLCAMVRVFSQYYRRVRILTEPRKHLLPVIFARIHMLKILNDTLKSCLRILNIKSVSQM